MKDREKFEKVLDLIQRSGVRDEHVTPDEMYAAMSEYNLLELSEKFSLFVNLIADIREVLKEDDSEIKLKESDILEVTLLSIEEAKELSKELLKADDHWWLRSPGYLAFEAAFVDGDCGDVIADGGFVDEEFGVRPALKIKPSLFKKGDHFSYKGYGWDVIDSNLALCRAIVGECAFRKYLKPNNANDYELSDIKKWLSDWCEEDWWEESEG